MFDGAKFSGMLLYHPLERHAPDMRVAPPAMPAVAVTSPVTAAEHVAPRLGTMVLAHESAAMERPVARETMFPRIEITLMAHTFLCTDLPLDENISAIPTCSQVFDASLRFA